MGIYLPLRGDGQMHPLHRSQVNEVIARHKDDIIFIFGGCQHSHGNSDDQMPTLIGRETQCSNCFFLIPEPVLCVISLSMNVPI